MSAKNIDPAVKAYLIEAGKSSIEAINPIEDPDDQYIPTLVVEDGEGKITVMVLTGGHPFNMLVAMLPTLAEMKPRNVSMTVDSYILTGNIGDEGGQAALDAAMERRAHYGGSLQAMFEAGEVGVSECLTINYATPTAFAGITLPYTRMPDGSVVWAEEKSGDDVDISGRMADALRLIWAL